MSKEEKFVRYKFFAEQYDCVRKRACVTATPRIARTSTDSVQNQEAVAHDYQKKIGNRLNGTHQKTIPRTAGAGNGQGRKPQWRAGKTKAIRVPEVFADELMATAKQWDMDY